MPYNYECIIAAQGIPRLMKECCVNLAPLVMEYSRNSLLNVSNHYLPPSDSIVRLLLEALEPLFLSKESEIECTENDGKCDWECITSDFFYN